MSTPPDGPGPLVGWETIEKVAAKADAERLEAMSEEQLDQELRKAGFDPEEADRVARRALQGRRRPRWVMGMVAAAAVLLVVLAWKRVEVVAFFTGRPVPIGPDRWQAKDPTPPERAAKLRGQAFAACGLSQWDACRSKLDEAKALDPAGEDDPKVTKAREDLRNAELPEQPAPVKPRP